MSEMLEGLLGAGVVAIIIAVVATMNIVISAIKSILDVWSVNLGENSLPAKIMKWASQVLDWISGNLEHKKDK